MSNEAATATTEAAPPTPEHPGHGLGASLPAADARAKTEGTLPYAADLWAEGLLWLGLLRAVHSRRVIWRGHRYRVERGGRLVPDEPDGAGYTGAKDSSTRRRSAGVSPYSR